MATTPRLKLPLVAASQAQKHVTHNEAILMLDILTGIIPVMDRDLDSPPVSPADGAVYMLGDAGSGGWSAYEAGDLALRIDGSWRRVLPSTGMVASVTDESGTLIYFDGSGWTAVAGDLGGSGSGGTPRNLLVNGRFAVNQRGFAGGALAAGDYGHDRFKAGSGGANYDVSGETVTHNSGSLVQIVEAPQLAGEVVILSVEDLAGGDLSVTIAGVAATLTAGDGRRTASVTVPGGSTGNITVEWQPVAGAVTYRRIQLNRGSSADLFDRLSDGEELTNCLRYFERQKFAVAPGFSPTATAAYGGLRFAPKRIAPAITAVAAMGCVRNTGSLISSPPITGYAFYDVDLSGQGMVAASVAGGLTAGAGCLVQFRGDALDIDAEL